jgi:hypothetical protein
VLSCSKCKYDVEGLPDGACPECGAPFEAAHLRWLQQQRTEPVKRAGVATVGVVKGFWYAYLMFLFGPSRFGEALVVLWIAAGFYAQPLRGRLSDFRFVLALLPIALVLLSCLFLHQGATFLHVANPSCHAVLAGMLIKHRFISPLVVTLLAAAPCLAFAYIAHEAASSAQLLAPNPTPFLWCKGPPQSVILAGETLGLLVAVPAAAVCAVVVQVLRARTKQQAAELS